MAVSLEQSRALASEAGTPMAPDGEPGGVPAAHARLMRRATYASVAVAGALVVVKLGAWMMTGSVAMLSSLVDSFLDVVASLVNLLAVRHALRPADLEHRFGHGKAEPLAGLIQSLIITLSALFVLIEAGRNLLDPQPIVRTEWGIAVMVVAIAATLMLVAFQRHVVRKTGSTAIGADALHYKTDLMMNVGVIAALLVTGRLDVRWVDPLIALFIAIYILYSVRPIARTALGHLMDREFPDADRARIRDIVLTHDAVQEMHDLRTRSSGLQPFIQLHIVLDPDLSLMQAHEISDEVEAAIRDAFPGAEVIIHADPAGVEEEVATFAP